MQIIIIKIVKNFKCIRDCLYLLYFYGLVSTLGNELKKILKSKQTRYIW